MPTDIGLAYADSASRDEPSAETPPGKDAAKTTHRVAFDLPSGSFERLKKLKETSEAASFGEVIKNAIRLYEYLIERDIAGAKFLVQEEGKPAVEVKLFS